MTSKRYTPVELAGVKTSPLGERRNKVHLRDFARVCGIGATFRDFFDSLPDQLAARDLKQVVSAVVSAHRRRRPVIWAMGAHVIKCGLSGLVIELMRRGVISAVALNGAGAIHDFEIALIGATSEDVAAGLGAGEFGMADETGRLMNAAINAAWQQRGNSTSVASDKADAGFGELLGRKLLEINAPHVDHSILAAGVLLGVPVTVHVAVGTDIIHMHPSADGAALGAASHHDFRLMCGIVATLGDGGVYFNVGSAVVLPEVFLKAVTVARNLGHPVHDFTTVNLDMKDQYRSWNNVVKRPTGDHGRGYSIIGHHELLIPLLAQAVLERLTVAEDDPGGQTHGF
ncbi:MAG: hypothetical protein EPO21_12330 [Chloroflexota bacterium]|nr:MAG: hypothetical protein EPO21_12330 [Chloroflexota bacterium]